MKTPADPSPPRRPRVPPEGLPSLSDPRRSAPAPCALGSRLWAAPGRCCWPGGAPWLGAVALGPWVLVCGADAAEPAETPHCGAWRGAGRGSCVGCRLLHTHVHTHTHTHSQHQAPPEGARPSVPTQTPDHPGGREPVLGVGTGNRRAEGWLCPRGSRKGRDWDPHRCVSHWGDPGLALLEQCSLAGASQAARAPGRVASPGL